MATTLPSNAECTLLEGDDIISVDPENYAEKNNVRGNSDKGSKSSQLHEAASLESYSPHNDPGATVTLSDRDAVIEKRLVGKTDAVLLPFMGIIVLLQYLDKAILSYAALLGMTKQLQLVGNEYSWAGEYVSGAEGSPLLAPSTPGIADDFVRNKRSFQLPSISLASSQACLSGV